VFGSRFDRSSGGSIAESAMGGVKICYSSPHPIDRLPGSVDPRIADALDRHG
jgi:hypothetical protein